MRLFNRKQKSSYPGVHNKSFYIKFDKDWFKKGDIIQTNDQSIPLEVLKVYPYTWWRRFLRKLGFRVRMMDVKVIKTNKKPKTN